MSTSDQSWSFPESPSLLAVALSADAEKWFARADPGSTRESGCPAALAIRE